MAPSHLARARALHASVVSQGADDAEHDFSARGTLAVECPRCRLPHGAYLTVWREGAPLPCRTYTRPERQHIVDHIPPAHARAVRCGCGLHDAMQSAGSRITTGATDERGGVR